MVGAGNCVDLTGGFIKEKGRGGVFGSLDMVPSIPTTEMPIKKAAVLGLGI